VAGIGSQDLGLVDVRSPEEYRGELAAPAHLPQEAAQRKGHIPTAVNVPWGTAVAEDGTFKPADELRRIYGAKGTPRPACSIHAGLAQIEHLQGVRPGQC
jgi:thiosulfate/3-mercaptopyruvate sulfurtransferase